MINPEYKLSPEQVTSVTLAYLRGIRAYACQNLAGEHPTASKCQQPLKDAEILGSLATDYLLGFFGSERWTMQLDRISRQYGLNYVNREEVKRFSADKITFYVKFLENTSVFPEPDRLELLEEYILKPNNFDLPVQDLFDQKLLILSPLSADYSIASLIHGYTQRFLSPECFRLKPIILTDRRIQPLKLVAMPDCQEESFAGITRVGVFVESNTTYRTKNAAQEAAHRFLQFLR